MTARLAGLARQGVTIVGVEPSCILTLTEEHLALQPDSDDAKVVAGQVRLVDELILDAIDAGHLRMDPASPLAGRRFLFHGHCHQKALAGTAATVAVAVADSRRPSWSRLMPVAAAWRVHSGSKPSTTTCRCRSAACASFPRSTRKTPRTLIAATGVSCRQQIEHGTGRRALHPLESIREAVLQPRRAAP